MFRLYVEGLKAQSGFGVAFSEDHFELDMLHLTNPDPGGPRWDAPKLETVAGARQDMLDAALVDHFDGLFMVDTDVIVGPGVLERLWAVGADVVYGVFWTEENWGQPEGPYAPQVWDVHPYGFTPETWQALNREGVNEVPVFGGGACTLIRGGALAKCAYWPLLESLRHSGGMWYGEDRRFALDCEMRGIRQVAVTGLNIVHLYKNELRTTDALRRARKAVGLGG
jgi:hypothetical protein